MDKRKTGFFKLVNAIGKEFFERHKDSAVFSSQETDRGLWCFLGIDLHPEARNSELTASVEEWDIYASCYVTDDDVVMDECRLPV